MQLRPDIQITSMIKAMTDVILPAVDSNNKLAVEQSQLIIGMLTLMSKQLPIQFKFDCDELGRLLATSGELKNIATTDAKVKASQERLADSEVVASKVLGQCTTDPAALLVSIREMRQAMCDIVLALGETADLTAQIKAEKVIMDMSHEQLLRDRAMLVMQGFERDPAALPSIESMLGLDKATA